MGYTSCPKCKGDVQVPLNAKEYPFNVHCPNCNAKGRLRNRPKNIRKEKEFEEEELDWEE